VQGFAQLRTRKLIGLLITAAFPLLAIDTRGLAQNASPDDRPLPAVQTLAQQVKDRFRTDRELQAQYTFLERRDEIDVSKLGKVKAGPSKIYEVYPSIVPGNTYKRLISIDGKPLSQEELEKNDAKHRKDVLAQATESAADRAKRQQEAAKVRAEEQAAINEAFAVYDITLVGREVMGGYPTIVAQLEPRPVYQPKTDDGRMMKKFRVRVWVHESEYQVVKIESQALEDLTFGWGILGRVHRGATFTFERRKVNDEVWMPARMHLAGTGRTLMFRSFSLDSRTEWWDYRKFAVKTEETFESK
jgi:hypothetical protein